MLPDKSLGVRFPLNKWVFCVIGRQEDGALVVGYGYARRNLFGKRRVEGECVWPAGERREGFRVFPAKVDWKGRNSVKIGFENFDIKTLVEENF